MLKARAIELAASLLLVGCGNPEPPEAHLINKYVFSMMESLYYKNERSNTLPYFIYIDKYNNNIPYIGVRSASRRQGYIVFALSEEGSRTVFQFPEEAFSISDKSLRELRSDKRVPAKISAYIETHHTEVTD